MYGIPLEELHLFQREANMEHSKDCPLHEDNSLIHECKGTLLTKDVVIEYTNDNCWHFMVNTKDFLWQPYVINYCPFCGDELDIITCKCAEIRGALKERELDLKYEGAI